MSGAAADRRPRARLLAYRAALVAAVAYCVAGGVGARWFPADGLDLYVSYVAGTVARGGTSPYDHAAYLETCARLAPPGGVHVACVLPFAYPPAWIPFAMVLSLAPWGLALAGWKLVSAACLAGIVLLTVRVLYADALDACDRLAVWCFALTLSPTMSVLTLGQSSLFIVCMLVLSAACLARGRRGGAGLALALAAIKPQLAAPFVLFLLVRAELGVLALGAAGNAALAGVGLYASGVRLDAYLDAAARWSGNNPSTSHIAVGIAKLLGHLTSLDLASVTAIGMLASVVLVGAVAVGRARGGARAGIADVLPVVLFAAPLGFRCNAYDMVALIPLFAWARARGTPTRLGYAIQALLLVLLVPRGALRLLYERLAVGLVSYDAYYVAETSFRSWILVLLVPPVLMAWRARLAAVSPEDRRD